MSFLAYSVMKILLSKIHFISAKSGLRNRSLWLDVYKQCLIHSKLILEK